MRLGRGHIGGSVAAAVVLLAGPACTASSVESFCDSVRDYGKLHAAAPLTLGVDDSMSPAEVESRVEGLSRSLSESVQQARALLDAMDRLAPPDQKADVRVATSVDRRYYDAIDTAGFDLYSLIGDPALEVSPDEAAAVRRVGEYTGATCGHQFRSMIGAAPPAPPAQPEVPVQTMPQRSAPPAPPAPPAPSEPPAP